MRAATKDDIWLVPQHPVKRGEPTWDLALFYPAQGDWSEEEYLELGTNWMVEFVDGCLEVLPMPTFKHQFIVRYLFGLLETFVLTRKLGVAVFAPTPVKLWPGRLREPDIIFVKKSRLRNVRKPPKGADLVMEVVSEGTRNRKHDLQTKRKEYAKALIPEYWIVDPKKQRITVLTLGGSKYRVHGEFGPGEVATSVLLPEFSVSVSEAFAAGQGPNGKS
jgi:Uma2 family endonuclease